MKVKELIKELQNSGHEDAEVVVGVEDVKTGMKQVNRIRCQECGEFLTEEDDISGGTWYTCDNQNENCDHSIFFLTKDGDLI